MYLKRTIFKFLTEKYGLLHIKTLNLILVWLGLEKWQAYKFFSFYSQFLRSKINLIFPKGTFSWNLFKKPKCLIEKLFVDFHFSRSFSNGARRRKAKEWVVSDYQSKAFCSIYCSPYYWSPLLLFGILHCTEDCGKEKKVDIQRLFRLMQSKFNP